MPVLHRTTRGWLGLLAATLLLTTACEAPLQPESRRQADASASASPRQSAAPSPSPTPTETPSRRASASPSVDVPAGLEKAARKKPSIPPRRGPVLGSDIGWPQCPKGLGIPERRTLGLPMPPPEAQYVVIGLTNGPSFTPNPCLADQVRSIKQRKLPMAAYAVISGPYGDTLARFGGRGPYDAGTESGRLANLGYQQARYSAGVMREAGLRTPFVWLDVEPVPAFDWSSDPAANAQVVKGAARGWREAGVRIGVYSTAALWSGVVGDLRLGLPEWRAAGETSREEALSRCADDSVIQGGPAVMGQWLQDSRDWNLTCPGVSRDLGRYFQAP